MKKSLLATTALAALGVATVAAPASAEGFEVKLGGFMEQWFGYTDTQNSVSSNADAVAEHSDVEIHISGKNTLDNGLTFGFMIEMEGESTSTENADEQYMTVEGSFGKIIMGSENTAPGLMHYGAKNNGVGTEEGDGNSVWGYGTIGNLSNSNVHNVLHNDDNSITFIAPRINGVQIGASFVPEHDNNDDKVPASAERQTNSKRDNGFGIAANYETSVSDMSFKISLAYSDAGDDKSTVGDDTAFSSGVQLGFGGFTYSLAYGERKNDTATAYNNNVLVTSIAYNAGPMGISLLYANGEDTTGNDKQDQIELGANYAIGPGVTAKGSVYSWKTKDSGSTVANGTAVVGGIALSF
jgi:predicted porin